MTFPDSVKESNQVSLAVDAVPYREVESDFSFRQILLPSAGNSRIAKLTADNIADSPLTLVKVDRLNAKNVQSVLGSVPAIDYDDWIALTFTATAAVGDIVDVTSTSAIDDTGAWLEPDGLLINKAARHEAANPDNLATYTLLVHPPSANATSIDLVMHMRKLSPAGSVRTLTFNNIQVLPTM